MTPRPVVWITRPQPGADRTAARLAELGYEPFILPLTEIRAVAPGLSVEDAASFDAVAVTSANALRQAPEDLVAALRGRPFYAVGDATAAEATARGFATVASAQGAVDDLAALIAEREKQGARILYLGGSVRAGDLEGKLAEQGISCCPIAVYSAEIVSYPTEFLDDAINRHAPAAVLFHSGQSARIFENTVFAVYAQVFENTRFLAISARTVDGLSEAIQVNSVVASEPNEPALLASLGRTLPSGGN